MRFSVCMLCNEDTETIQKFVDFYRQAGAEEILIYLDFNTPIPDLAQPATVRFIKGEEIFVEDGQPSRPENFHQIQRTVYNDAFARFSTDWLLICDVDEFIACDRPLDKMLAAVPADWHYFRIPVAEAVWGPGDPPGMAYGSTYFRSRAPRGLGKLFSALVYGRAWRFTKAGLTGHAMGKYFIKKGSTIGELGIHVPMAVPWTSGPWCHDIPQGKDMFVYHFEAIGYDRWHLKWAARAQRPKASTQGYNRAKRAYIEAFAAHQKTGTERRLFDALYTLGPWQVRALKLLGLLRRKTLWPETDDRPGI